MNATTFSPVLDLRYRVRLHGAQAVSHGVPGGSAAQRTRRVRAYPGLTFIGLSA